MFNCKMIDEARETQRGNNFLLETIKCLLIGAVIILASSVVSAIFMVIFGVLEDELWSSFVSLVTQVFGIGMVMLYCCFAEKRPLSSMGFVKKGFVKQYLIGLAVGFVLFFSVVAVGVLIGAFKFVGISKRFDLVLVVLFFVGFIFQGMFEEVFCRSYIMVSLARKSSVVFAVVMNSLIFMALHLGNEGIGWIPCVNLMLFSIFASVYTLKTGNIWGISAIHTVWNFVQGCFFGLQVSGETAFPSVLEFASTDMTVANGGAFGPEGGVIVTVVLVIAIVLLFVPVFKRENK